MSPIFVAACFSPAYIWLGLKLGQAMRREDYKTTKRLGVALAVTWAVQIAIVFR